jgi:hypothetical protein
VAGGTNVLAESGELAAEPVDVLARVLAGLETAGRELVLFDDATGIVIVGSGPKAGGVGLNVTLLA